jgi:antitoxin VapB
MALSIKSEEADRLARELADTTGETITQAVLLALRERLQREQAASLAVSDRLARLVEDVASLPVLDTRDPDALVGYDEDGLPA